VSLASTGSQWGVPPVEAELKLPESEAPPKFIERGPVSAFFGGAVLFNAVFIGLDAQVRASGSGSLLTSMLFFGEVVFGAIFLAELMLRIYADRCPKFLFSMWNILDVFLVAASLFDLTSQIIAQESGAAFGQLRAVRLLKVTRMLRLVRIVRVFRFRSLLRSMRGLIVLLQAIKDAMKALAWFFVMLLVTTYLCAIVTTEYLGISNTDGDAMLDEWFGDMFKSMFTLIALSTMDDWVTVTRYVANTQGGLWFFFFLAYVLTTNLVLLNVALATLVSKVMSLQNDLKSAKAGEANDDDVESWMLTPSSMDSGDEEENQQQTQQTAAAAATGGNATAVVQNAAERLTQQLLSDLFDLTSELVGKEGVNQSRVVTERSLGDALVKMDVQERLLQVCPGLTAVEPQDLVKRVIAACPKHYHKAGLMRQEFAEACLALKGELSMNHFVAISLSLQQLEQHVDHELAHLNKHQRKMNRRFLKLRHRLRKVYHFDGAPRKMVEMVTKMQKLKESEREEAGRSLATTKNISSSKGTRSGSKQHTAWQSEGSDSASSRLSDSDGSESDAW